jgi:organic hydroperoxide reductase OsmC/OhrA
MGAVTMQDYPHHYVASATANATGHVRVSSPGLEHIESAGPAEFGGPGDRWSPETLLVASVADCYILSFRAVARAAKLDWDDLECRVVGDLNRIDHVTRFTHFDIRVTLDVPEGTDEARARKMLQKAEDTCLVTNSMTAEITFAADVRISETAG